jgi:hypothetical protein
MELSVHNAEHLDSTPFKSIQYLVMESPDQRLPGIPVPCRVAQRILFNRPQPGLDLVEKFAAQAAPALLISVKSLGQVRLSLAPDDERAAHFLRAVMRAQTSFHGDQALGFWRHASKRSSISRLSSSVVFKQIPYDVKRR